MLPIKLPTMNNSQRKKLDELSCHFGGSITQSLLEAVTLIIIWFFVYLLYAYVGGTPAELVLIFVTLMAKLAIIKFKYTYVKGILPYIMFGSPEAYVTVKGLVVRVYACVKKHV